jgi:hypothetical protein
MTLVDARVAALAGLPAADPVSEYRAEFLGPNSKRWQPVPGSGPTHDIRRLRQQINLMTRHYPAQTQFRIVERVRVTIHSEWTQVN